LDRASGPNGAVASYQPRIPRGKERYGKVMSILQLLLVAIVLPGMFRVFTGISGFLTRHPALHLQRNAKKLAFIFVVVTAAMFATPLLTLGLPAVFRFAAWAIYATYVVIGASYVWDAWAKLTNRGSNNNSGN